jgi:hypothetical protein
MNDEAVFLLPVEFENLRMATNVTLNSCWVVKITGFGLIANYVMLQV